jgi:hypothetical protein
VAGLMAAEYQRVMKRAQDLKKAELEEELAAIKHDPKVAAGCCRAGCVYVLCAQPAAAGGLWP